MPQIIAYLKRHWNGAERLSIAVLLNLVALRLALCQIGHPVGVVLILFITLSALVLLWQTVGGWRLANNLMRQSGDLFSALLAYAAVLFVVIYALAQTIELISSEIYVPEPNVMIAPQSLLLVDQGRTVIAAGEMTYHLETALKATLATNPEIVTLRLDSAGGNIFAARAIALLIAANTLTTEVTNRCFSACTIAFAAGAKRRLGPDGQLGFHGYAYDSEFRVQTSNVTDEQAHDRVFLATRGFESGFLDRVYATPHSELWIPDRTMLLTAGVLTKPAQ